MIRQEFVLYQSRRHNLGAAAVQFVRSRRLLQKTVEGPYQQ